MAPPTEDSWWFYFNKEGTIAICKHCNTYTYNLSGSKSSTNCLSSHLKNKHAAQYAQQQKAAKEVKEKAEKLRLLQPKLTILSTKPTTSNHPSTSSTAT